VSRKGSSAALEVRLLGELEVWHDGHLQPLPASKKTRALLAYLVATNNRSHLRERLCALLWDGPDDPRAALRWSLTKLRPLLGYAGAALVADRERVGFVGAGNTRIDVELVRGLLAAGVGGTATDTLREAVALYRGEFLEGLELPGCYRYHQWCVGERETLRALRTAALTELVARAGAEGDWETALRHARDRVAVDPLTEAAHVDVVRILGRLGRTREALAQYETCRRMVETELGSRISTALEQARRELGARGGAPETAGEATRPTPTSGGTPAAPSPTSLPASAAVAQDAIPSAIVREALPLVGRDVVRGAIEQAVADVVAGRGGATPVLLFVGDPGIGKTRLMDLVADEVETTSGTVLRGRAFEAEMIRPYGPWLDALPAGWLAGDAAADRTRLFETVADSLRALAAAGSVAILLDDVQWLDEASAALLHFIGRAPLGGRVLLACAARPGELGDNAAALRVVRTLNRERRLAQYRLEPLGQAETAALVRTVDAAVDVAEVFTASEGNPLYALELARAAAAGSPGLDGSLEALLDERLGRLDPAARDLLQWAAALGRSFAPEVLGAVTGLSSTDLLSALEHLEARGVVRPGATGYDFAHDLIRQAAYRRLSEPRRRLVHMQIARALDRSRAGDDTRAGEIAHHAAIGGDATLAAEASAAAGRRSLRLFALAEAAELATRGLAHLARVERLARVRLQIELYTVLVQTGQAGWRRVADLEASLSRAIVEAQEVGLHSEAARGFHARSILNFTDQNFERAREASLRAIEEVGGTGPDVRGRQLADSARCFLLLEREVPRAQALIGEARTLLGADAARVVNVAWAVGLINRYVGDRATAAQALAEAVDGFAREETHWERCQAMAQRVMLELEHGNPAAARQLCAPLREIAAKMTGGSEPSVAAALDALAARALGERAADAALATAIDELRTLDANAALAYVLNTAAAQDLAAGNSADAERRASAALAAAGVLDRRSEAALARATLGRLALARGDRATAEAELEATRADRATPLRLSARATKAVDDLSGALGAGSGSGLRAPTRRARRSAPPS